ncbi:MAG: ABC transporter ATP-binding protein [Actinomycetota bacterium]|nr:ABC transporter ATP-binding protein [Actinomycetota bacterium]
MNAEPILAVRDVWAGYGETPVLRGVDLELGARETLVVVGPNGHGKTTLLRTISGLAAPDRGEIRFGGEDITGWRAEHVAELGLIHVPQGDHVFPDLTVEENLLMGAFPRESWRRRGEALRRVYDLLPTLADRRRQRSRTLSGGERRQLALGRGLMREANALLVDEPSLGLAPVVIETVYAAIAEIAAAGTPILLVEENFNYIQEVADRVAVLEMGLVVRAGSVAELRDDPTLAEAYLGVL